MIYLSNNCGALSGIDGAWLVMPAAFDFVVAHIFFIKPQEHIKWYIRFLQSRYFGNKDYIFYVWAISLEHYPFIVSTSHLFGTFSRR